MDNGKWGLDIGYLKFFNLKHRLIELTRPVQLNQTIPSTLIISLKSSYLLEYLRVVMESVPECAAFHKSGSTRPHHVFLLFIRLPRGGRFPTKFCTEQHRLHRVSYFFYH